MRTSRTGDSVKALLEPRSSPTLARVSEQAARQVWWRKWLGTHLAADAFVHVSGIVERHDTLVIFTESAAWSARVRYAVAEVEGLIKKEQDGIRQVMVRVMPRG